MTVHFINLTVQKTIGSLMLRGCISLSQARDNVFFLSFSRTMKLLKTYNKSNSRVAKDQKACPGVVYTSLQLSITMLRHHCFNCC